VGNAEPFFKEFSTDAPHDSRAHAQHTSSPLGSIMQFFLDESCRVLPQKEHSLITLPPPCRFYHLPHLGTAGDYKPTFAAGQGMNEELKQEEKEEGP
jgi:hypothetical protein